FGGLDMEVLSEAPKSVLYRLEYWQGTARVIVDHPLLGVWAGDFQEAYAMYKLPRASETPADPHNFLLEMWATAGTPALALLLALLVAVTGDLSQAQRSEFSATPGQQPAADPKWLVLAGALIGLLVAAPLGTALGYS